MIEVEVQDVLTKVRPSGDVPRIVNDPLRIVLLRERDGERVFPIWIGPRRATRSRSSSRARVCRGR